MIRFETHKLGFLFFYSDVLGNSSKNLRIKYCSNSGNWFSASIMDFHDWKKVSAFLKIERRGMYGRVGWRFLRRGLVVSMVLGIGSMCSVLEYIQVSARQDDKYWSLGKSASIYSFLWLFARKNKLFRMDTGKTFDYTALHFIFTRNLSRILWN